MWVHGSAWSGFDSPPTTKNRYEPRTPTNRKNGAVDSRGKPHREVVLSIWARTFGTSREGQSDAPGSKSTMRRAEIGNHTRTKSAKITSTTSRIILMLHISLFSGIGGFDLASEWMGWTNIASCEINPFGRKVLEYYWPNAYHHDDIKTLTYTKLNEELTKKHGADWRADDIVLTGGFPCQPYSLAGKRLGKEDERHLWPEMLRVIREVSPKWIVGENVFGLVNWSDGLVFHEVQTDLENLGYEVQSYVLPACGVNAPHRRDRIFIIAYGNGARFQETRPELTATRIEQHGELDEQPTTHANNTGGGGRLGEVQAENGEVPERHNDAEFGNASNERTTTDSKNIGSTISKLDESKTKQQIQTGRYIDGFESVGNATDTERIGYTRRTETSGNDNAERIRWMDTDGGRKGNEIRSEVKRCSTDTGNADATDTNGSNSEARTQREVLGQPNWEKANGYSDVERPNKWQNFPTQSPICSRNDGLSSRLDGITFPKWRNESIKAGGNAVVPPLIYNIFKTIQQYEDDTRNNIQPR